MARRMPPGSEADPPRLTVPMHYNTFQAITQDPEAFAAACKEAGFAAKVLQPGEEMTL